MQDRIPSPGKEGRMLITPEDGSPAFYARVTMADEPTQTGTELVKRTLLRDETADLFGMDNAAVPDDVFSLIGRRDLRIDTLTYTGTGVSGKDHPTEVTFDFAPKLLMVFANDGCIYAYGGAGAQAEAIGYTPPLGNEYAAGLWRMSISIDSYSFSARAKRSADGKTISWYGASRDIVGNDSANSGFDVYRSRVQMNVEGDTYLVVAIGWGTDSGNDLSVE